MSHVAGRSEALTGIWRTLLCLCLVVLAGRVLAAEIPSSPSPHYVLDEAGWLSAQDFQQLDAKLESYERETSNQLVVGIFRKLPEGAELFDFSQRVFEAWKPGQKERDNGILLLVFSEDRLLRIHTGYGLEGSVPDALANRIIRDDMTPLLRAGDRSGAIRKGTNSIIAATRGEYQGTGRTNLDPPEGSPSFPIILFIVLLMVVISIFTNGGKGGTIIITPRGTFHDDWGGGWSGGSGGGFGGGGGGGFSGGGGASGGW